jgi:CBS domain-containing protein
MSDQAFEFLSEVSPFSDLPKEELKNYARRIWIEKRSKGTLLYSQGKTAVEHLIIVNSGSLEAFHEIGGKKSFSVFLHRTDLFGGVSMLMNAGISFRTLVVEKEATYYVMPKKTFLDICNRHELIKEYFVDIYSTRMLDESYISTLATEQTFQFLHSVIPFSFLPDEELERVAGKLSIVHYPKGSITCVQGQTKLDFLYIIQRGAAERYYEENNEKRLRALLGEGDIYGGITLLVNNGIAVRTLKCTEDCYFYILPKKDFLTLCTEYESFSEYFTDTFGKRMLDRSYASIVSKTLHQGHDEQQFFNQPVDTIYNRDVVSCDSSVSIQEAAKVMNRHRCSSIFVRSSDNHFVGVITDSDLRKKVIAEGYDIHRPVADIMSSPISLIPKESLIFEAMMQMSQKGIKHLAVTDADEKVIGIVTNRDLLSAQGQSPFFLIREISETSTLDGIIDKRNQLPGVIKSLIHGGAKAKNVTRLITAISDTILNKLIEMAIKELGDPPAEFVFMIMGSEGRKEQTLKTDQDNAIVYRDVGKESESRVQEYFLQLGEKVCSWLDQAGYAFCEGGNMAKNPKWCQPLSVWKDYFSSWIYSGGPEELLKSSIFFDFKGAYGDMKIIGELRQFLFDSLKGWAGFFRNMTENALYFKPPIGFFRNFVVESKGQHRDSFDIKAAMQPIVDFARIYALKNKIDETNTQDRLFQLYVKKALPWQDYNELDQAYAFMMQLRFVRQISAIMDENAKPDNYINPKKLSRIQQTMLKEIFNRIEKLQAKIGFEFTGIG